MPRVNPEEASPQRENPSQLDLCSVDPTIIQRARDWYFEPRPWESEVLYERVGVRSMQRWLIKLDDRVMTATGYKARGGTGYQLSGYGEHDLESEVSHTRFNEGVHAPITVIIGAISLVAIASGHTVGGIVEGALALANTYPVPIQRYNRLRLQRILDKKRSRAEEV